MLLSLATCRALHVHVPPYAVVLVDVHHNFRNGNNVAMRYVLCCAIHITQ